MDRKKKTVRSLFLFITALLAAFLLTFGLAACDKTVTNTPTPVMEDPDQTDEEMCRHVVDEGEYVEPTDCKTLGYTLYRCTLCGEELSRLYGTEYGEHTEKTRYIKGSCVECDKTEIYCSVCGKVLSVRYGTTLGEHNFKTVNELTKATCTQPAYRITARCTLCGETKGKEEGTVAPHTYGKGVYTAATCIEGDFTTYTCSVCGDTKTEKGNTPSTGHDYNVTFLPGSDCEHFGTALSVCKVCGDRKEETTAVVGPHKYTPANATAERHCCSVCGEPGEHQTALQSVSADEHQTYCRLCKYILSTENHVLTQTALTEATCTDDGYRKESCVCGYSHTETLGAFGAIDQTGKRVHAFDAPVVLSAATCTEKGKQKTVCHDCGYILEEILPMIAHDYRNEIADGSANIIKAATCIDYAVYKKVCAACGGFSTETFSDEDSGFAPHSYVYTSDGTLSHTLACSVCNEIAAKNESHTLVLDDRKNGYSHVVRCVYCTYSETEAHIPNAQGLCSCGGTAVSSYAGRWDVSASGDESLLAYLVGTTLTVRGSGFMKDYSRLSLPPYAAYKNTLTAFLTEGDVFSIGSYALEGCENLTDVTIGESVRSIGKFAFSGTKKLESLVFNAKNCDDFGADNNIFRLSGTSAAGIEITFGAAVTKIPSYFAYPSSTEKMKIGAVSCRSAALEKVGAYAFRDVGGAVDFSCEKIKTVDEYAFYGAPLSSRFILGDDLSQVGAYAFFTTESGSDAAQFIVSGKLSAVGAYAFYGRKSLNEVRFTDGFDAVPDYAFAYTGVTIAALPEGVKSVGKNAFYGCESLKIVDIPTSLAVIGDNAFYATGVTSLSLNSVRSIGDNAFAACTALSEADFDGNDVLLSLGKNAFYGCSSLRAVDLGETKLTSVAEGTFFGCENMNYVRLPNVASIGKNAFNGCCRLYSVTLPSRLTSVGVDAFRYCYRLVEVENKSSLSLVLGGLTNGQVATNAKRIRNGESRLQTADGFVYLALLNESGTAPIYENGGYSFIEKDGYTRTEAMLLIDYVGTEPSVSVPETYDEYPVVIGEYAFYRNRYVDTVSLGGNNFFFDTSFIGYESSGSGYTKGAETLVYHDNDVTYTLVRADGLYTLRVSGTGTVSGTFVQETFAPVIGKITAVEIQNGITAIGENALKNFDSMSVLSLPEGLAVIERGAFFGCRRLAEITLPSTLTAIGNYAFYGCVAVEKIVMNCASLAAPSRDNYIFYGCGERSANGIVLTVSDGVPVQPYLFNPVYDLAGVSPRITEVAFTGSVPTIGTCAFRNVGTLKELVLPAGVSEIGEGAFAGTNLVSVTLPLVGEGFIGYYFGAPSAEQNGSYLPRTLKSVTVSDTNAVAEKAFYGCDILENVVYATKPNAVGANAFYGCVNLTAFDTSACGTIGDAAFYGCERLTQATLTAASAIGREAYRGCSALSAVSIGEGLAVWGQNAFVGCDGIRSFDIASTQFFVQSVEDGFGVYDNTKSGVMTLLALVGGARAFTVPDTLQSKSVTTVAAQAFCGQKVVSVSFGVGLNAIGASAFEGCDLLESVTFAPGCVLATVEERTFYGCEKLSAVSLPETVSTIGSAAFYGCSDLESFVLPSGVTTLGDNAFGSCRHLKTFTFGGNGLSALAERTFYGCVQLTSVALPQKISVLANSAFEGCSSMVRVTFAADSALTTLSPRVFANCRSLTELALPGRLATIDGTVFTGCSGLEKLSFGTGVSSMPMGLLAECVSLKDLTVPYVGIQSRNSTDPTQYPFGVLFSSAPRYGLAKTEQSYYNGGARVTGLFYLPISLTKVTVLGGNILYGAFSKCAYLTEINIAPTGTTVLGEKAFYGCSALKKVVLSENLVEIQADAFASCTSYDAFVLPATCTKLEKSAFTNTGFFNNAIHWEDNVLYLPVKTAVENVFDYYAVAARAGQSTACVIKEGVTYVLSGALEGTAFVSVVFPRSLKNLGQNVLQGNTSVTSVTTPFVGENEGAMGYLSYLFGGKSDADNTSLPASLKTLYLTGSGPITNAMCSGCGYLEKVVIGSGYTKIGPNAFASCPLLASVDLSSATALRDIDAGAFACNDIPNRVLRSLIIPSTVTSIGQGAFAGCIGLTYYSAPFVGGSVNANQVLGYVFNPNTTGTVASDPAKNGEFVPASLTAVAITGTSTIVPISSFYDCSHIETVLLTSRVDVVQPSAFQNCTALTHVVIVGGNTRPSSVDPTNNGDFKAASVYNVFFDANITNGIVGRTTTNTLRLLGGLSTTSVVYSSSNETVATVDSSSGTVTCRQAGTTTVTASVSIGEIVFTLSYTLNVA